MLRMLQHEIAHNFQLSNVKQVAAWFHFVAQRGALSITEVDCKKRFDNICPRRVVSSFSTASKWLYKKHRWRSMNSSARHTKTQQNWIMRASAPVLAHLSPLAYLPPALRTASQLRSAGSWKAVVP